MPSLYDNARQLLHELDVLPVLPEKDPGRGQVLARMICPLHDGADNKSGLQLYYDGFACHMQCHRVTEFGHNHVGLIRHLVYKASGQVMAWRSAFAYASANADRLRELVVGVRAAGQSRAAAPPEYDWDELAACLELPDPLFLARGYSPKTLTHFGVGRCVRILPDGDGNRMGWPVLPVRGRDGRLRGYSARNPRWKPGDEMKYYQAFSWGSCLYNEPCLARKWRGPLFVVEGQPCVLRLHEAGYPQAVAVFGDHVTDPQLSLLRCPLESGVNPVYVIGDNDEGGRQFALRAVPRLGKVAYTRPLHPPAGYKDVGDMPAAEVRAWLAGLKINPPSLLEPD